MREKVLSRNRTRERKPEVIVIDSSSEQSPYLQNSASPEKQSESHHQWQSSFSSDSSEKQILQNLRPELQQKRPNTLMKLRGMLFQERGKNGIKNNLKKTEVEALYKHIERAFPPSNNSQDSNNHQEEQSGQIKKFDDSPQDQNPQLEGHKNSQNLSEQDHSNLEISVKAFKRKKREKSQQSENGQSLSAPIKKPKLMEQLEADLGRPTEELSQSIDPEARLWRKRQNRKREYQARKQKKIEKEARLGKKKDKMSNTLFNSIEDYFN